MSSGQATTARRWVTDPLVPLAALAVAGLVVAVAPMAAWVVLGGLAGYALSGSV